MNIKNLFLPVTKIVEILETKAKYSIRVITRGEDKEYLPMVKANGLFNNWLPIVRVYNRYVAMPYEHEGGISQEECHKHIKGYKEQLRLSRYDVDYIEVEDEEPVAK